MTRISFYSKYRTWTSSFSASSVLIFFSVFLLVCLILSPYAMNGFWGDDALNSQVRFWSERTHGSVWGVSVGIFKQWLSAQGRLMAGFLHGYSLFYVFSDRQSLKLAQCISVLVNIGMFSYILLYLGFKKNLIFAWTILFVGLFQIQDALDPVAAFTFHYPFLAIQLFLSLILLLKWSSGQNTKYLVLSMILWFWAMMYYEINAIFLFIAVMFVLKFSTNRRAIIRNLVVVALPAIVYGLLNYYLRTQATDPNYEGSSFGKLSLVPLVYIKQLTSSIPLSSYLLAQQYKSFSFINFLTSAVQSPVAWGIFLLGSTIFYLISNTIKSEVKEVSGRTEIIIIGAAMLLLPPCISAISARYQHEIRWGAGTLSIYYQYFGTALILLWILSRFSFQNTLSRIAIASTIGLYLSFNATLNLFIVKAIDADYFRGPRELFISQARHGLFKDVKDGDIVEVTGVPHYVNANLIFEGSGKNIFVPNDAPPWFATTPEPEAQKFFLSRNSSGYYELKNPAIPEVAADAVTEEIFAEFKPGANVRREEFSVGIDQFAYMGPQIIANGWAYNDDIPPKNIHVVLWDGEEKYWIGKANRASRPDVAGNLNIPVLVDSGFSGIFSSESIPDGEYEGGILLTTDDGIQLLQFFTSVLIYRPVEITIKPFVEKYRELPLRVVFDVLNEADSKIMVAGWAIMEDRDSKNCKIKVLFKGENGSVFVSDVNSTVRKDVTEFFKNIHNFDHGGFDAAIPKKELPPGKYQLGVVISYPGSELVVQFADRYIELH